jgi:flagellar basal-body rod protein FlgB
MYHAYGVTDIRRCVGPEQQVDGNRSGAAEVIANNLANSETPGYIRRELDFQTKLKQLMSDGETDAINDLQPELVLDETGPLKDDGNNVSISNEMNEMMENGVYFNLLAKAFSTRVNILRSAITGTPS